MGSAAALELNPEAVKPPKGRIASKMDSGGRGCNRSLRSKSVPNSGPDMDVVRVELTDTDKKKRIASETTDGLAGPRKMPKRAAACSDFKKKSIRLNEKSSVYEIKEVLVAAEESEAIRLTEEMNDKDETRPNRRLADFILHDFDGASKPFEMSEVEDLYITGVILPLEPSLKDKEKGVRCEGFGRVEEWSISGYEDGSPVIWISTDMADYECVKPASSYRESFAYFYDKATICVEVFKKLSPNNGGNPNLSFEELLARVVRSVCAAKAFHGVPSKDFIISLGEFIYTQLIGLDDTSTIIFTKLPVLETLLNECKKRKDRGQLGAVVLNGNLQIKDSEGPGQPVSCGSSNLEETEDEKLAHLLQEEEYRKSMKKQNRRNTSDSQKKFYIKINEDEIANDYPLPAYYKPSTTESDEYMLFDDYSHCLHPDELPRRMLHNWSLYNSESRLISLELLPIFPGAQVDVTIFGSGNMTDDDGSGFCIEGDSIQSSLSGLEETDTTGIPIYLSAVKEWMIEFGSSTVFISIRTDTAWYRLGRPSKQYSQWYEPVLKTANLAIGIIKLLKEQSRASKLSFPDVIKKIAEFERDAAAYISSNPSAVERYIVVHGQIILRLFSVYPEDAIRRCAFVSVLSDKMEERHHTKLVMNKKILLKQEVNLNPRAALAPVQSKRKAMRATTTKLINSIWRDYYSNHFQEEELKVGDGLELKEEEELEEEENEEEENCELSNALIHGNNSPKLPNLNSKTCMLSSNIKEIKWDGESIGKMSTGEALYRSAVVRGVMVSVGSSVMVAADCNSQGDAIVYLEYLFERLDHRKMAHGRLMQRGCTTVLGNASNDSEVFLTNECLDFELTTVKQAIVVEIRSISVGHEHRKENVKAYNLMKAKEEERKKSNLPMEYFCKSLYWPERGAFFDIPVGNIGLGTGFCDSCKLKEAQNDEYGVSSSRTSFIYRKVEYSVQDFVYVAPSYINEETGEVATYKAGRSIGLKAYVVCQLVDIEVTSKGSKQANLESTNVKLRRFFRPEDISAEKAYISDIREVYYSEEILNLSVDVLEGKCDVRRKHEVPCLDGPIASHHIFFCEYLYDPSNGSRKQLPANMRLRTSVGKVSHWMSSRKSKGKAKVGEDSENFDQVEGSSRLATLDIFAGCGGLSEGLQHSGVTKTKWAIEYDEPAAHAFMLNHPDALVYNDNCNVILRAIMEKCGDKDDCISTSEAAEKVASFGEEKMSNLPVPGEVDFINGGPPCQGFSGMNRFSQSTWSKVQCEMILAFLSFADYFRPKFFLLENVRNFVSYNKGQTFRLALASLLEMGYQVRFGILEAGAFGVSQSRKRAFIWAAAPGQILPEWPEPMHVFGSPELRIPLPGNVHYAAVRSTAGGAPFRSITVRDTIGDLPEVLNGASNPDIEYKMDPVSWFQKQIRGNMTTLFDHISKEMNELNYIRCQRIPRRPGADWRDLPDEKVKLSSGQIVDLIPWCLPNTAKRHNQWKGLFGRLDWEGNFPTSVTDPQPMGKVGMCFHPEQNRIVTVRECARSQGFPDSYRFFGNIQSKHRQIGNAVPPPLAFALGRKLKEAVEAKAANSLKTTA